MFEENIRVLYLVFQRRVGHNYDTTTTTLFQIISVSNVFFIAYRIFVFLICLFFFIDFYLLEM